MNNETIILGKKYICQPIGLKQKVVGEVISKLENCVVICVDEYHDVDRNENIRKMRKSSGKIHSRLWVGNDRISI